MSDYESVDIEVENFTQLKYLFNNSFRSNCKSYFSLLYVRFPKVSSDKITISFDYSYRLIFNTQIVLSSPETEKLSVFLHRLKRKINCQIEKKLHKKNKLLCDYNKSNILVDTITICNQKFNANEDISCQSIKDVLNDNSTIHINEISYNIVINAPIINIVKLPKIILTSCIIFPDIEIDYGNTLDVDFQWYMSINKQNWQNIDSGFLLLVQENFKNHYIKVKCYCKKTNQCIECISVAKVSSSPKQLALENRWKKTLNYNDELNEFRIVSYNLLAKMYSESGKAKEIFRHCHTDYLEMNYRKGLLIKELFNYHSDIICLQEVDASIFRTFLYPFYTVNNYDGIFQAKDFESQEGQAIFWRKSKFKILKDYCVESISKLIFDENTDKDRTEIRNFIYRSPDLLQEWIQLKQCIALCVLQSIKDENQLIVANTHLYFKPTADLIRYLQVAVMLVRIKSLKYKYPNAKIIVTGDFNDSRGSNTIKLVFNESYNIKDSLPESDELYPPVNHDLSLQSAYNADFTNYVLDFSAELDFIFYDNNGLICKSTVPLPSLEEVTVEKALPNKYFPSDHLALVADFQFKN